MCSTSHIFTSLTIITPLLLYFIDVYNRFWLTTRTGRNGQIPFHVYTHINNSNAYTHTPTRNPLAMRMALGRCKQPRNMEGVLISKFN